MCLKIDEIGLRNDKSICILLAGVHKCLHWFYDLEADIYECSAVFLMVIEESY